jgi:hypothetical protein
MKRFMLTLSVALAIAGVLAGGGPALASVHCGPSGCGDGVTLEWNCLNNQVCTLVCTGTTTSAGICCPES